ncbi:MAG: sigma-70 family RNA polymerase sigma factor [Candidatus Cloacimonetes bacterium]|nr:sigma-70 family RNA polymerase sigma factor [Candidatus Cloacimonadota bacterium]
MINVNEDKALQSYLYDISKYTTLSKKEEKEVLIKAKSGDSFAKEMLIKSNLKFVVTIASKYQNRGLSLLELISEGNLGLLIAIEKFDPEKDLKLISYAVWWIRQKILYSISKKIYSIGKFQTDCYQHNEEYNSFILENNNQVFIINKNEPENDPKVLFYNEKICQSLREAVDSLNERESYIVKSYYGLYGYELKTLSMLARKLGISKEYVRKIKMKSMEKIYRKVCQEKESEIFYILGNVY